MRRRPSLWELEGWWTLRSLTHLGTRLEHKTLTRSNNRHARSSEELRGRTAEAECEPLSLPLPLGACVRRASHFEFRHESTLHITSDE